MLFGWLNKIVAVDSGNCILSFGIDECFDDRF